MNDSIKNWGQGIPEYTRGDILKGRELHAFCTNNVVEDMKDDGYTIERVLLTKGPTGLIASKDGKRYGIIVAGGVFPDEGKISYMQKFRFLNLCKSKGVVPIFASIGLKSKDPIRAEAGLALRYDSYYWTYTRKENLLNLAAPAKRSNEYKAYCVEKIVLAYERGEFNILYGDFADDIQLHSQWVLEPMVGKEAIIEYYNGKAQALKESSSKITGNVVVITERMKRSGNVTLMSEPGKVCGLIAQQIDGNTNWIFISPKFDEHNKLIEIALNDPELFSFRRYYSF